MTAQCSRRRLEIFRVDARDDGVKSSRRWRFPLAAGLTVSLSVRSRLLLLKSTLMLRKCVSVRDAKFNFQPVWVFAVGAVRSPTIVMPLERYLVRYGTPYNDHNRHAAVPDHARRLPKCLSAW